MAVRVQAHVWRYQDCICHKKRFHHITREQAMFLLSNAVQSEITFMTKRMMTKEQSEDFERYMECVRGLDEDQVSRLAGREYETVQEMYEELKKEMLIKHERDQKRIAELKQQIAAKNEELARKEALKKELESQILLEKAEAERLASHCMKAAK